MCVYIFTTPSTVCRPPGLQNNRPPERCGAERRPCMLRRAPPRCTAWKPSRTARQVVNSFVRWIPPIVGTCAVTIIFTIMWWNYRFGHPLGGILHGLGRLPFLSGGCGSAETKVGWAGRPCRFALASTSRSPCNGSCGAAHAQLLTAQPAPHTT